MMLSFPKTWPKRVKFEDEEQRHTQLEDMRHRACERVKNENEEQRHARFWDMWHRACEQVKNEIHTWLEEQQWRVKNENEEKS